MNGHAHTEPDRELVCARMHPSLTPEGLTLATVAGGLDTEQQGAGVTFLALWDDQRVVTVRRWAIDSEASPAWLWGQLLKRPSYASMIVRPLWRLAEDNNRWLDDHRSEEVGP